MSFFQALLVFITGGIGCVLRYFVSSMFEKDLANATLFVNIIGCFFIGILYAFFCKNLNYNIWISLSIGFLGGFTTFSTWGLELFKMLNENQWKYFISYILISNLGGILMVFLGYKITNYIV